MTDIAIGLGIGAAGCLVLGIIGAAWLRLEIASYRQRCRGQRS